MVVDSNLFVFSQRTVRRRRSRTRTMMMPRCKPHTNMPRATCAKPTLAQQPLSQSRVIVFGVPVLTAWLAG